MIEDGALVIVGGGSGRRFGGDKLLVELDGMPLFLHAMRELGPLFSSHRRVMVAPAAAMEHFQQAAMEYLPEIPFRWVAGGAQRTDSVRSGLAALDGAVRLVAIHDAARPLASAALLEQVVMRAREVGAAIPGRPVPDTLKRVDDQGLIVETVAREGLFRVETPQCFLLQPLLAAYEFAGDKVFTDDAAVMEYAGHPVAVVAHDEDNFKLTWPADLERLRRALAMRK